MTRQILAALAVVVLSLTLCGCHRGSSEPVASAGGGVAKGGAPVAATQAGRVPGSNVQFGTRVGTQ